PISALRFTQSSPAFGLSSRDPRVDSPKGNLTRLGIFPLFARSVWGRGCCAQIRRHWRRSPCFRRFWGAGGEATEQDGACSHGSRRSTLTICDAEARSGSCLVPR